LTSPQGATWSVAPHLSGLSSAQGGFETPLGWFGVSWSTTNSTSDVQTFTAGIITPSGTTGIVTLPFSGTITIDDEKITGTGTQLTLSGGTHNVTVQS
jgi:hypothetical protein